MYFFLKKKFLYLFAPGMKAGNHSIYSYIYIWSKWFIIYVIAPWESILKTLKVRRRITLAWKLNFHKLLDDIISQSNFTRCYCYRYVNESYDPLLAGAGNNSVQFDQETRSRRTFNPKQNVQLDLHGRRYSNYFRVLFVNRSTYLMVTASPNIHFFINLPRSNNTNRFCRQVIFGSFWNWTITG